MRDGLWLLDDLLIVLEHCPNGCVPPYPVGVGVLLLRDALGLHPES